MADEPNPEELERKIGDLQLQTANWRMTVNFGLIAPMTVVYLLTILVLANRKIFAGVYDELLALLDSRG